MKTILKHKARSVFLVMFILAVFLPFCEACNNLSSNDSIMVGYLIQEGEAEIRITDKLADSIMQIHNKLSEPDLTYSYSNAWIHVLEKNDNTYDYFLAVDAVVTDSEDRQVGSFYTIYAMLEQNGEDLVFAANGASSHQESCSGYCCSQCLLKEDPVNHWNYCDCTRPTTTPSCTGEARCDHSKTLTY